MLGLGAATAVDWVEVRWPLPSTRVERFTKLEAGRYVKLVEGTGEPVADAASKRR